MRLFIIMRFPGFGKWGKGAEKPVEEAKRE
jgi:hypothetical protein